MSETNSDMLCAIVEPRRPCALLETVRNISETVGCHVLLAHGRINLNLAKYVQKNSPSPDGSLLPFPVDNLVSAEYSDTLMSASFWEDVRDRAGERQNEDGERSERSG